MKIFLPRILKLQIAFILLLTANTCFAQTWEALGSGITGGVYAVAVYNNDLYVAGDLTMAGGVAAATIAKWNGTSWSAVGSGTDGYILALAVYNGELYAGGDFNSPATDIAKWNGTSWSAVGGSPISGYINSMCVSGTNLIIGGELNSPGNGVAQWDGSAWTTLGTGITNGGAISTPLVSAIAEYNSDIYAGGYFDEAGVGNTVNRIAKWNGSSWSALSSGLTSSVNSMIVYRNELYVGGNFDSAGGIFANHIAKWNGASWSNVTSGTDVSVRAFVVLNNNLFVGGSFVLAGDSAVNYIARLDSNGLWHPVGSGTGGVIYAMTTYNNKVCVAGSFTTAGGVSAQNIALYSMPTGTGFVDENSNNISVVVFPNPAKDGIEFKIQNSKNNFQNVQVKIFDVLGKEIKNQFFENGDLKVKVSNLQSGIYFYKISGNGENIKTGKLVIE